jgi:hypothetical protein
LEHSNKIKILYTATMYYKLYSGLLSCDAVYSGSEYQHFGGTCCLHQSPLLNFLSENNNLKKEGNIPNINIKN